MRHKPFNGIKGIQVEVPDNFVEGFDKGFVLKNLFNFGRWLLGCFLDTNRTEAGKLLFQRLDCFGVLFVESEELFFGHIFGIFSCK